MNGHVELGAVKKTNPQDFHVFEEQTDQVLDTDEKTKLSCFNMHDEQIDQ